MSFSASKRTAIYQPEEDDSIHLLHSFVKQEIENENSNYSLYQRTLPNHRKENIQTTSFTQRVGIIFFSPIETKQHKTKSQKIEKLPNS